MRRLHTFLLAGLAVSGPVSLAQALDAARQQAREGKADAAIAILQTQSRSADAQALLCEVYGSIDRYDDAIRACETAAQISPNSSAAALHLAIAYGNKASHSGSLTGMRMVGKIRSNFERAVQLDGKSAEALSDLGQFYVEAPGVVGGGLDKAKALLPRLQAVSPERGHRLAGMIAAKANDEATAVQEFQAELAVERSAEAYVDLAQFNRRRKHYDEAASNAHAAIEKDGARGGDTVDAAQVLLGLKRDIPFAQDALRRYIAHPHASAVTPLAHVHTMLGESLASTGDNAAAQEHFRAALALAKDYAPARKALGQ